MSGGIGTISPDRLAHEQEEYAVVELTRLVGECEDGECPTLYATDRGTLVVQGDILTDHGREVPGHEALVEIPVELIRKAVRANVI